MIAQVLGVGVAAAMIALLVAVDEDVEGGVSLVVAASHVGQLGFFAIIDESASHAAQQAVVQVEAQFGEGFLDDLQADLAEPVVDVNAVAGESLHGFDTRSVE